MSWRIYVKPYKAPYIEKDGHFYRPDGSEIPFRRYGPFSALEIIGGELLSEDFDDLGQPAFFDLPYRFPMCIDV